MNAIARPASPGRNLLPIVWLSLTVVLYGLVASAADPALAWPWFGATAPDWSLIALNILPFAILAIAFSALTRRVILASWIGMLVLVASYAANAAKLEQLQMPLLPGDFHFLQQLGPALSLFGHYIGANAMPNVIALAVLAISIGLFRETPWPAKRGWTRLAVAAISIALGIGLVQGWSPWRAVYSAERLRFEPWSVVDSAKKAGMVGNLVLYNWELAQRQDLRPDRNAAARLLREHAPALRTRLLPNTSTLAMPGGTEPDIVIIQSESLFDPARLNGAPKDTYLRNFHRLAQRGLSGNMKVPTYAGGTIRTEFEVLTGMALEFFPGIQYPYFEIVDKPIPGIVRTLSAQGYRTTAIHPNSGVFWNRNQAYAQIGFDHFIDGDEFSEDDIVGLFTGDAALTDRVLAELDTQGPPQLIFAVSMENHGPFDWRPGLDSERMAGLKLPAGLDEGGEYWMRNYLYLLEDADHELGRLAAALEKRERRTLLLFYGDHLPALPPVYHQIGFVDGQGPKAQPVPWLLLDNGRSLAQMPQVDTTAWMLPSLLLETAGIGGDRYFAALGALRDSMPGAFDALAGPLSADLRAMGQLRFTGELEPVLDSALGMTADDRHTAVAP
jgi:phosphoglycerol transferase MdoB-like AlkP superfamily enzyme